MTEPDPKEQTKKTTCNRLEHTEEVYYWHMSKHTNNWGKEGKGESKIKCRCIGNKRSADAPKNTRVRWPRKITLLLMQCCCMYPYGLLDQPFIKVIFEIQIETFIPNRVTAVTLNRSPHRAEVILLFLKFDLCSKALSLKHCRVLLTKPKDVRNVRNGT